MGSLIPLARRTELVRKRQGSLTAASRQFDLVFDDTRLRGMTQEERSQTLRSLASAARGRGQPCGASRGKAQGPYNPPIGCIAIASNGSCWGSFGPLICNPLNGRRRVMR
jgi:hypothetical protein